jgi:hypothetical protein
MLERLGIDFHLLVSAPQAIDIPVESSAP